MDATAPRVVLYAAPGCHLCAAARRVLDGVDISASPELERRYRERIPVVEVGGEEAFTYFVHPEGLRRRLAQSRPPGRSS